MFYNLRKKTIRALSSILVVSTFQLDANGSQYTSKVCGIGESYIPPDTQHSPHRVVFNGVYLVFWEQDFSKVEIEPYSLVCKKLCAEGTIKTSNFSRLPFLVIRNHDQITFIHADRECKSLTSAK